MQKKHWWNSVPIDNQNNQTNTIQQTEANFLNLTKGIYYYKTLPVASYFKMKTMNAILPLR